MHRMVKLSPFYRLNRTKSSKTVQKTTKNRYFGFLTSIFRGLGSEIRDIMVIGILRYIHILYSNIVYDVRRVGLRIGGK